MFGASQVRLPNQPYLLILDFLSERFAAIGRDVWRQRMLSGKVFDAQQRCVLPTASYQPGALLYYFREVPNEVSVPFTERILYQDQHLLAVDKPHFFSDPACRSLCRRNRIAPSDETFRQSRHCADSSP